jgi:HEAT repeat protein
MARFGLGKRDVRKLEKERDIEGLIELLSDEDDELVFQVIEALTRIGDPRGVEALMVLVADPSCSELIRTKAWLALDVGIEREAKKRTDWR